MKNILKNKGLLIGSGAALLIVIIFIIWNWSVDNKVVKLTERFTAQVDVSKTAHDAMWKTINQDAQVADKYYQDFEKIFSELIDGRYAGDGDMLMKWIQEHNPTYNPELYKQLMSDIKTERAKFKRAQDICIDVKREFLSYIQQTPTKWFVNSEVFDAYEFKTTSKEDLDALYKAGGFESEVTYSVARILIYQPVLSTKTNEVFEKGIDDDVELYPKEETKTNPKDTI